MSQNNSKINEHTYLIMEKLNIDKIIVNSYVASYVATY